MKQEGFEALLAQLAHAPEAAPDLLPDDTVGEHFTILRRLGRGGMGVVYLARDARLEREVALKVAGARGSAEAEEQRLRQEAKALAKLAHPNVVAVYEVGSLRGLGVFIAMERIDGGTLRDWLQDPARSPQARLQAVLDAGRGLHAAHETGLVHRDFKPENVLLGQDGRARVSDFGLALEAPSEGRLAQQTPLDAIEALGLGTPGYMPPEQLRGDRVDARADQYAFAVVVYEALFGAHPFGEALKTVTTVGSAVRALESAPERLPPAPKTGSRGLVVPARLRHDLLTALQPDPANRHASLAPLLDSLSSMLTPAPGSIKHPRRWIFGAMATFGTAVALVWSSLPDCAQAGDPLIETWVAVRRPQVVAHAHHADIARALALMDAYVEGWVGAAKRTCDARDTLGEEAYMERWLCLKDLERDFRAAAAVLATSSTTTDVIRGPSRLFRPDSCDKSAFARARPAVPRIGGAKIEAAREDIARARALEDAGQFEAALDRARKALSQAQQLDFRPIVVEARYMLGRVEAKLGRYETAAQTLEQSYLLARKAPHDRLAAEIAGQLAYLYGFNLSDVPSAKRWADLALADLERIDVAGPFEARVLMNVGSANAWSGETELALEQHTRAIERVRAHRPNDHFEVALARVRLGETLAALHRLKDAHAELERAIETLEQSFGASHPALVRPLTKLSLVLAEQGDGPRAVQLGRRAVAVAQDSLGTAHASTGLTLMNLGVVYAHLGRIREAREAYEGAVQSLSAALGPEHPDVALVSTNLGLVYDELGEFARALKMHEAALDNQRRRLGPDHPSLVPTMINRTSALVGLKRWTEARAAAAEVVQIADKGYARGVPFGLQMWGEAEMALGHPRAALELFARAVQIRRAEDGAPRYLAESLLSVARAERALGQIGPAKVDAQAALALLKPDGPSSIRALRQQVLAFLGR